jgi:hypothetical protein
MSKLYRILYGATLRASPLREQILRELIHRPVDGLLTSHSHLPHLK